jgi:hypothetical protein
VTESKNGLGPSRAAVANNFGEYHETRCTEAFSSAESDANRRRELKFRIMQRVGQLQKWEFRCAPFALVLHRTCIPLVAITTDGIV